ncbi:uridine kinase [Paenarthrobacter aurescens]|uniref:uridine kinase n=1 Tax=Paenarthrobacter aurescens TaxID=43663 RepID=UPI0021BFFA43|nr:uridine kinase [Paenarthrobacter aurescens]MCT9868739.1 uridine kinase [Paenarthrobacter aurescens]
MIGERTVLNRPELLRFLAEEVLTLGPTRQLIAIDGVDGSGKSTFAKDLAPAIKGRTVMTIHVDDFLNPQEIRHRRGRTSPVGFWLDTYDYAALNENVLAPLSRGGDGRYRPAFTDSSRNASIQPGSRQAPDDALVLVEGMFLHRDELFGVWDYSIFLDVPFAETARRMSRRDGSNPDPDHPSMQRYVGGQRLYFENAQPWSRATRVIDNTLPQEPRLMSPREAMGRHR